ncbi:MAG: ABC transporter substrate-binding protein [Bacteroidaceae bacterium]|nr:ABC transporter substrate-binding protein [Bacteroidaceae bacterium]
MNRLTAFILTLILHTSFLITSSSAQTDCKLTHKTAKKETIYGISHLYGITEEELIAANPQLAEKKLKKGQLLCIPYSRAELDSIRQAASARHEAEEAARIHPLTTIKVGIILPFALDKAKPTDEAQKMLDFYKGILLIVDSLKRTGLNLDILTLDEGSADASKIQSVLQHTQLREANLIIGPGRAADIPPLTAFAQQHHIPLVIPFSNTDGIIGGRPYVFQCNTQLPTHYPKLIQRFIARHAADNIIFVEMNDKSPEGYTAKLVNALTQQGINYQRVSFTDMDTKFTPLLQTGKNNLLLPSSPTSGNFEMLCLKLNNLALPTTHNIQIIGSPEWQTLPQKSQKNMYKYNATYFTTFYTNTLSSRTQAFNQKFQQTYNHTQILSYPRYAEMGHDIAAFFLTALQRYGDKFFNHIQHHDYNSLQLPLHFQRKDDQSGYTNTATYIIYYKTDGDIILTTF